MDSVSRKRRGIVQTVCRLAKENGHSLSDEVEALVEKGLEARGIATQVDETDEENSADEAFWGRALDLLEALGEAGEQEPTSLADVLTDEERQFFRRPLMDGRIIRGKDPGNYLPYAQPRGGKINKIA